MMAAAQPYTNSRTASIAPPIEQSHSRSTMTSIR